MMKPQDFEGNSANGETNEGSITAAIFSPPKKTVSWEQVLQECHGVNAGQVHFQAVTHGYNHASADEIFMSQGPQHFQLRPQVISNSHGSCDFQQANTGFLNQPVAFQAHSSFEGSNSQAMSGDFGSASFSQGGYSPPGHHQQFLPPMNSVMSYLMRGN